MTARIQTMIGLVLLLLGGGLLCLVPVVRFSCLRVRPEQVDCRIRRSVVGLVGIGERVASGVVSAEYSSESRRSDRSSRTSTAYFHVRLHTAAGQEVDAGETAFIIGDSSEEVVDRINLMIGDRSATSASAWQGQWFPMFAGLVFFLFGVLSIYPFVLRPALLFSRRSI